MTFAQIFFLVEAGIGIFVSHYKMCSSFVLMREAILMDIPWNQIKCQLLHKVRPEHNVNFYFKNVRYKF